MLGSINNLTIKPPSLLEGRETAVALVATVVWVIVMLGYGAGFFGIFGQLTEPREAAFLEIAFFAIVLILPIALVWIATSLLRRSLELEASSRELIIQMSELRKSGGGSGGVSQPRVKDNRVESLSNRYSELAETVKKLETSVTSVGQVQAAMQRQIQNSMSGTEVPKEQQQALPFEGDQGAAQDMSGFNWAQLVKALNFPRDENDSAGFKALREAKQVEALVPVLAAAEDIMNFLAQEGVYMDDFKPLDVHVDAWRDFSKGTRGEAISHIGTIDAEEAFERIAARNRADHIFRDANLYFLRRFDILLRETLGDASDAEVQQLANSRSGRAFLMLGRAAGMFG